MIDYIYKERQIQRYVDTDIDADRSINSLMCTYMVTFYANLCQIT